MLPKLTLYVKSGCGWCEEAEDWLTERGYEFERIDVSMDREAFAHMRALSGQTKAPTMTADDELLADFDVGQLEVWLKKHGWFK